MVAASLVAVSDVDEGTLVVGLAEVWDVTNVDGTVFVSVGVELGVMIVVDPVWMESIGGDVAAVFVVEDGPFVVVGEAVRDGLIVVPVEVVSASVVCVASPCQSAETLAETCLLLVEDNTMNS